MRCTRSVRAIRKRDSQDLVSDSVLSFLSSIIIFWLGTPKIVFGNKPNQFIEKKLNNFINHNAAVDGQSIDRKILSYRPSRLSVNGRSSTTQRWKPEIWSEVQCAFLRLLQTTIIVIVIIIIIIIIYTHVHRRVFDLSGDPKTDRVDNLRTLLAVGKLSLGQECVCVFVCMVIRMSIVRNFAHSN